MPSTTPTQPKPVPAALTDPMLNASRELGLRVNPNVLNNFNVNSQIQYHNNIGNPNGVLQGQPIIDIAEAYRNMPQIIQEGADLLERNTISKAKTTVAKAAGVAALRQAEVIGAITSNKVIKSIYDGTRAYLGKPELVLSTAAKGISFSPAGFAKNVGKSMGLEVTGLGTIDKAMTAAEVTAAAAGSTAAYRTALQRGYAAAGAAIESAVGGASNAASKLRLGAVAPAFIPTTMGNPQAHPTYANYNPYSQTPSLDINAYQTAEYERWKERDDKIQQQRIEEAKKANIHRINESMSSTGFKDDHISAYFKNKA